MWKLFVLSLLTPLAVSAATIKDMNSQKAPFKLPPLVYPTSAFEPVIDKATMDLHHGKHHQAYVDKLNEALGSAKPTLLEVLRATKNYPDAVRNNAGGHWNHSFFWTLLVPETKTTKLSKKLESDIVKTFGSLDEFKGQFEQKATGLFGSGWVWLIRAEDGSLKITTTGNQDNPLMDIATEKGRPILGLDVWEHAYYLNYQNRRADYVKGFWKIVNWEQVSKYDSEK